MHQVEELVALCQTWYKTQDLLHMALSHLHLEINHYLVTITTNNFSEKLSTIVYH